MPAKAGRPLLIRHAIRTGRCRVTPRVIGWGIAAVLSLLAAACVQPPPVAPAPVTTAQTKETRAAAPRHETLSPSDAIADAEGLRLSLSREVPPSHTVTGPADAAWIERAKAAAAAGSFGIDHPQLMVVVDRNPRVQQMRIVLAQPKGSDWLVIGGSKVSTGRLADRREGLASGP